LSHCSHCFLATNDSTNVAFSFPVKKTIHQDNPPENNPSGESTIFALKPFISRHRQENPSRTIYQKTHHSVSSHSVHLHQSIHQEKSTRKCISVFRLISLSDSPEDA
jgi:hypothetical protein